MKACLLKSSPQLFNLPRGVHYVAIESHSQYVHCIYYGVKGCALATDALEMCVRLSR